MEEIALQGNLEVIESQLLANKLIKEKVQSISNEDIEKVPHVIAGVANKGKKVLSEDVTVL